MATSVVNRMLVAAGITAVALCGLNVPISAQPPRAETTQGDQQQEEQQKAKKRAQQERGTAQQTLTDRQEQRLTQHREHLDRQRRVAQQQSAQLQRQNWRAQYRYQQQYVANLRRQQVRIHSQDRYYHNYFLEGFRRGYEDGCYGRYRDGRYSDGRWSILVVVPGSIPVFEAIRQRRSPGRGDWLGNAEGHRCGAHGPGGRDVCMGGFL